MVTVWAHHAQAADRQAYANQAYLPGDVNGDREVSAADLFTLVGLLYSNGGPAAADADGDGAVAPADVFYLVAYLFAEGTAPR
jgi:hypothetical protein